MRITFLLILSVLGLSACEPVTLGEALKDPIERSGTPASEAGALADKVALNFINVVERVQPVAEQVCRERRKSPCDFRIVIDDRPGQSPNAFQTVDNRGRPIIAFNVALLTSVNNQDELAFVMGHESAHHILRHLEQQQKNAAAGAAILSGIVAVRGATAEQVEAAQKLGAQIGARSYSKDFELEADRLGTLISLQAGYNPLIGAQFFIRLPDPGNRFLGTHPPNADRIQAVRQAMAAG